MNVFTTMAEDHSGLSQLRLLVETGARPPIADTLDFDLVEVERGRAVFAAIPGRHAYNPIGSVHGGYIATLLDSACGCAVHSALSSSQAYTTLELKTAFHKAITEATGPIRAEGTLISLGRRVAYSEARIVDADGTLYATATSTLLVFDRPKGG